MCKKNKINIEKAVFYILIVIFIVIYLYIILIIASIHNEYKKCITIDATVSDISIANGDINVTYDYRVDKKSYHNSQKAEQPKELKIGNTTHITVNKNKPQKIMQAEKEGNATMPYLVYLGLMTLAMPTIAGACKKAR